MDLDQQEDSSRGNSRRNFAAKAKKQTSVDVDGVEQSKMTYDSTGMYHWCPSRDITECLMDRQEAAMTVLQVSTSSFKKIPFILCPPNSLSVLCVYFLCVGSRDSGGVCG